MPKKIKAARARVIGDKLSELIEIHGTTKSAVARGVGVDPSQITRVIKGTQNASIDLLEDLADYFDVSTDYLLGRE